MPANTDPIYTRVPDIQWIGSMTAANVVRDMSSGTTYLVFTADATNGGFIRSVRIKNDGAANNAATKARIFINNGAVTTTGTNNTLFGEISIPVITVSDSVSTQDIEFPMSIALPAGYRVYITLGTAPGGSAVLVACAIAGKY